MAEQKYYKVVVEFEDPYDDSPECVVLEKTRYVYATDEEFAERKAVDELEDHYFESLEIHTAEATEV